MQVAKKNPLEAWNLIRDDYQELSEFGMIA